MGWFILGAILGCCFGVILFSLFVSAKKGDNMMKSFFEKG
jgi:hypothetical protein